MKFDPYNHFGFLTNRVGRLIKNQESPKLKAAGYHIPGSCLGIMADLWMQDGITQKELGSSLIKTKSSITKMLEALLTAGLIIKKDDPTDKRSKLIFLTKKGKELRKRVELGAKKMEDHLLADIPADEICIAKKVLKTLYINLSEQFLNQPINE